MNNGRHYITMNFSILYVSCIELSDQGS